LADSFLKIKRIQKSDPKFLKRVFVSHYCNIPFHLLDKKLAKVVEEQGTYPLSIIDDLYTVSIHLMRNFELAPYANDTKLEDLIASLVNSGKIKN